MISLEYKKYSEIFPEIKDKKNWKFDGAMGIPSHKYVGPSIEELKKKYNVDENTYEI